MLRCGLAVGKKLIIMKTLDYNFMENVQGGVSVGTPDATGILSLVFAFVNTSLSNGVSTLGALETLLMGVAKIVDAQSAGL